MPANVGYCHVYNKGINGKNIFNDKEDFAVFSNFLNEYLEAPRSSEELKKTFTVNGKVFKGVPHLPKNYFGKIKLISKKLAPDHFHLFLEENSEKSLEKLMRSLLTRYSIYFNKKYKRTGPLFNGTYKLIKVEDEKSLEKITLESTPDHKTNTTRKLERSHFWEMSLAGFLILVGLGVRNIEASAKLLPPISKPSPTPEALDVTTVTKKLVVKIKDGSESVNVRQEPSVKSQKIGEVLDGDTLGFISLESGWYEVILADGSNGFISSRYIEELSQ